jgi:hypothetical protein
MRVTVHEATGRVSDAVPRRFTGGDGLRAVAAVSVLVFHAAIAALLWKHYGAGGLNGEGSPHQFKPLFGPFAALFVNMRAGISPSRSSWWARSTSCGHSVRTAPTTQPPRRADRATVPRQAGANAGS